MSWRKGVSLVWEHALQRCFIDKDTTALAAHVEPELCHMCVETELLEALGSPIMIGTSLLPFAFLFRQPAPMDLSANNKWASLNAYHSGSMELQVKSINILIKYIVISTA